MTWLWMALSACKSDADYDQDGYREPADCDDGDPNVWPGAEEVAYDSVDQDCDGTDLVDRDEDTFQAVEAGGPDCNDFDAEVFPGAREIPYDGVDQNCDDWNDDDFDQDGFEAMGHGGDDCDDTEPKVVPLDLDGDGYSACTGDCDENDPNRNEEAVPVCGNGFDDDCDEVSDCTPIGVLDVAALGIRLSGSLAVRGFGTRLLAPGDLDGDGVRDIVVTGERIDGSYAAWALSTPLAGGVDETAAWGALTSAHALVPGPTGDIDGDTRPDLVLAQPDAALDGPRVWLVSGVAPGEVEVSTAARLTVVGAQGDALGESTAVVGAQLALGAPGIDAVQLLDPTLTGVVAFGVDGARIDGPEGDRFGSGLHGYDEDGDGVVDLMVGATGDPFGFSGAVYLIDDPPSSGVHAIEDLQSARLDTRAWGQSNGVFTSGDLDDDGSPDAVVSLPFADGATGGVAVLLDGFDGNIDVEDVPVQRLGLGSDTFGWSTTARDFDGDGVDDLVIGGPAAWASIGDPDKPGGTYLWYGPLDESIEHTLNADLLLQGDVGAYRSYSGYAIAFDDVDGDGGVDLLVSSPLYEAGVIDVLPGGLTGLYGL